MLPINAKNINNAKQMQTLITKLYSMGNIFLEARGLNIVSIKIEGYDDSFDLTMYNSLSDKSQTVTIGYEEALRRHHNNSLFEDYIKTLEILMLSV